MFTRRPGSTGPRRRHSTAGRKRQAIEDRDDETRLYLGPARNSEFLEVVTIVRDDGSELAIHAMKMRPKYQNLLADS